MQSFLCAFLYVFVHVAGSSCSTTSGEEACEADDFSTLAVRQRTQRRHSLGPVPGDQKVYATPLFGPPTVVAVEFRNQCDFDIQLDGFGTNEAGTGCVVAAKTECTLGTGCTTLDYQPWHGEVEGGPRCDVPGTGRREVWAEQTGFAWWSTAPSKIPGRKVAVNMIEMNTRFHGEDDILGHVSYSQYQRWSMASRYLALDENHKIACPDGGAMSTVPDPVQKEDGLHCGAPQYDHPENGNNGLCAPPGKQQNYTACPGEVQGRWPAEQPHPPCCFGPCTEWPETMAVNPVLKDAAWAINGDGSATRVYNSTGNGVEFWGTEYVMYYDDNKRYAGHIGSFMRCTQGAQVTFQVTACGPLS